MSESFSSISTSLTSSFLTNSEVSTGLMFNLKICLLTCLIIFCISCLMSCMNTVNCCNGKCKCDNCKCDSNCIGDCIKYEHFGNDDFFSYKDTINPGYFISQTASLRSPDQNLIFGNATKIISPLKDINTFYLELQCSLYVLNGNPFVNTLSDEHYQVYLSNNDGKKELIGRLRKDQDGIYKLSFNSSDIEKYSNFNKIIVTFLYDNKEQIILNGQFTIG